MKTLKWAWAMICGEDYTKAACRAVEDAIRHSSLILFRSLGFDHMICRKVTIAATPDQIDTTTVAQKRAAKLRCMLSKVD